MWRISFILLLWFQPQMGSAQFGMEDLIRQQIQNHFLHTNQMINMIAGNIFNTGNIMARTMAEGFQDMIMNAGFGFPNLGAVIENNIRQRLAPLQNLGNEIFQTVQQNLMPVYALNAKNHMQNGVGGTTIATYQGQNPRSFIIQNGNRYECRGRLIGPRCMGQKVPFQILSRGDYCFAKSYAVVNNRICLSDSTLNIDVVNNLVNCQSVNHSPVLMLNSDEYNQLCNYRMPWQATFTYYADPNDPQAVPIPNSNPYVRCLNNVPGVCVFQGTGESGNGNTFISDDYTSYSSF